MQVLAVTPEIFPLIKTGGLADVTGALPIALAEQGVTVRNLVPGYPVVTARFKKKKPLLQYPSLQGGPAWVLAAEGKHDEALRAMSAAADAEDRTEKHPVTPGPLAPARELYGVMLLERGMAKEALVAFETTKAKEPNRFHGYAGAAQAAEKLGDKTKAKENYQRLIALTSNADSERIEIAAARKFVAAN